MTQLPRVFNEVSIRKEGNRIIIEPIRKTWLSYAELRLGAARSSNKHKHDLLISEFREQLDSIHSWDLSAADHFAELQALLLRKGTPIGVKLKMPPKPKV